MKPKGKTCSINFRAVGTDQFTTRVKAYVLKTPSVKVPMKRRRLLTFGYKRKPTRKKIASLQLEMKRVQKCMWRKISNALKYIEVPRALCDIDESPVKGQKSLVMGFYRTHYKDTNLIIHAVPADWVPHTVVLEGMFLIHTKPHTQPQNHE